jgi:Predicted membrane protein (DUF2127)
MSPEPEQEPISCRRADRSHTCSQIRLEAIDISTNLSAIQLTDSGRAGRRATPYWLRLIAVFEATKGLLVLLTGLGLLSLLHRDVEVLAEELVERRFLIHHLRLSGVLLRAAENVTDSRLWALASVALAYSAMRFIEAYGLWNQREWGQWLGWSPWLRQTVKTLLAVR